MLQISQAPYQTTCSIYSEQRINDLLHVIIKKLYGYHNISPDKKRMCKIKAGYRSRWLYDLYAENDVSGFRGQAHVKKEWPIYNAV